MSRLMFMSHIGESDPAKQAAYRAHEYAERKKFQLFALSCGLMIYALFGVLDLVVGDVKASTLLTVRYGIGLPLMALLTLFFAWCSRSDWARLIISAYMLVAGGSIAAMIAIVDGPVQFSYPIGVMVVICFGAGFCGQDFRQGLVVNTALVTLTSAALLVAETSTWVMVSSIAFLVSAVLIMAVATLTNEMLGRARFEALNKAQAATSQAVELYHKAQESNHTKGQFLATVSHELRTPLNAIIGFAEMMQLEMFGPLGHDRYREYTDDIKSSGEHLSRLIEDIIDFSKAEADELRLEPMPYPVSRVVSNAVRMCQGLRDRKEQTLTFENSLKRMELIHHGDENRIRKALVNVLGNAIKFTPEGGAIHVAIGIDEQDGSGFIEVIDDGPGISAIDLETIRQPFRRVDDAYKADSEGLGLGLSLVDKIMQLHGGALEIESTVGHGCCVRLRFAADQVSRKPVEYDVTLVS